MLGKMLFETVGMNKRKQRAYLKIAGFSLFLLFLLWTTYLKLSSSEKYVRSDGAMLQGKSVAKAVYRTKPDHTDMCLIPYLKYKQPGESSSSTSVSCRRLKPLKNSCNIAKRLFHQLNDKEGCPQDDAKEFCSLQKTGQNYAVSCNTSRCKTAFELGHIDSRTGTYTWRTAKSRQMLERAITILMKSQNATFCLIQCKESHSNSSDHHHDYSPDYSDLDLYQYNHDLDLNLAQILNLPPSVSSGNVKKTIISRNMINFNLIFIDSVSRHHFFRSLPKTVKHFEEILLQHSHSNFSNKLPIVLDFELVQAIRSRTYESLQALFAGLVNPFEKPFSTLAMPPSPLKTEKLLKPLKDLGYKTLWLEDLCYLWEWGISKDLLVHDKELTRGETWKKLQKALDKAGIDSLGNTYAQCKILDYNGVNDHFHGPDKVCYNGKHQHYYSLDYLRLYQDTMHSRGQPYLTFYQTNIGHEDTGVRIQDFDVDFVEYLEYLKSQDNTLTIIFSDHGNAYGKFMEKSQEARIELFHPFLFMILPKGVRNHLDHPSHKNLISNQNRLISLLDLHYTLTYLISGLTNERHRLTNNEISDFNKQFNVSSRGLFSRISESRTCSQIPRINPNLCICEGFETSVSNSPYHFILGLFAVGELNNHIQEQRRHGLRKDRDDIGGFGSCQRLFVKKIENVRESRNKDDSKIIKMDIHTQSSVAGRSEVFFVTMETPLHHHGPIQLTKFERLTAYSQYGQCSDSGVELQLCVCDLGNNGSLKYKPETKPHVYKNLTLEKSVVKVNGENCVHVMIQTLDKGGVIFEAYNLCNYRLSIKYSFETSNLILSSGKEILLEVFPNDVIFIMAGLIENEKIDWTWSVQTVVEII